MTKKKPKIAKKKTIKRPWLALCKAVYSMRIPLTIIIIFLIHLGGSAQVQNTKPDSLRLNLLLKTSHADSVRKDYLAAIKHLNQYVYLKDSLLEITKQRQFNQLQSQYQTAKKDLEINSREKNIHLLTGQNKLTDKNLLQTRHIRNIIIVLGNVAALLLALSYLQFRLKKKANLNLEAQQHDINQKNTSLQYLAQQKDALLEEKELLIKEIHHRVKNNLQVVISLLNTQSAYLNDSRASAAIRQSQHRMQSISLIHQKLYQSESRALINMKEYAHELVQYLQQSFDTGSRITIKLNIDDIDLDVLRAVPIGLILNEAITNAIKYAFPDNGSGCIEVELSCIDGHHLKLVVIDNGAGLPPEVNIGLCQSLGINLMKGMCKQVSGRLDIQNKNGVIVMIEFPMDTSLTREWPNDDITPFGGELKPGRINHKI